MRNNFKKLWTPSLQHFFGELFKQIIFSKKCLVVFQKKKKCLVLIQQPLFGGGTLMRLLVRFGIGVEFNLC